MSLGSLGNYVPSPHYSESATRGAHGQGLVGPNLLHRQTDSGLLTLPLSIPFKLGT